MRLVIAAAGPLVLSLCGGAGPDRAMPATGPSQAVAAESAGGLGLPAATAAPATCPAGQGEILGRVVRRGGRDPRSGHGSADPDGGAVPLAGDPVEIRDADGHVVATAVTGSDGVFEFPLQAGEYVVTEDIRGVTRHVRVTAGRTTAVTLTVPGS